MGAQVAAGDGVTDDVKAVHDRLRAILVPLRGRLVVSMDGPDGVTLEIPGLEGKPWGYVAGTRVGKRYVSYYLMAAYAFPDLTASMSPELLRRKQGKSCFNFAKVDAALFAELEQVTRASIERYLELAKDVEKEKAGARG